ncbi:TRAP-type C4-dicarboxylate transport system, small permease component [Cohaesibacter sp. ES.047]|uniref:TRAP transporter small permease n=1 Tax=Cohaesibacter sp. ES.047 TaxID=1798205 RepID=UPI000BB79015|nr:TRAP transporter small permease [Cohaesibacter sp. ES.047]SNY91658.1 TRAP-type C4-dicarboxylate transport system, small permease component [Cohaesibacter sp. ES.047]
MKPIHQAAEWFVRLMHNLSAILLGLAVILVFVQVVTRFLLGDAAVWTEVLARGLIIWSTFLVAGAAFRFGTMIPIDFIRSLLPPKPQIWMTRLVTLLCLIFMGVLFWYGLAMAQRVINQRVAMLDFSMSVFYLAIPLGALFAVPGLLLRHLEIEREEQ